MTSMKIATAAAVALFAVCTTVAFAQTTPATPPATTAPKPMSPAATTPAPKKTAAPRSEKSLACSREATAKGLKGKPRKAFRKQCMKKAA
jgi:hypothetical protein